MRILMTTDTVGGVWTFSTTLTEQLLQRGHTVHLISFGRKPLSSQAAWAERQHRVPDQTRLQLQAFSGQEKQTECPADRELSPAFTYLPTEIPLEWMQNNGSAFVEGRDVLLRSLDQHTPDLVLSNQFSFGALDSPVPRIVVAHSDVLSWARACRNTPFDRSPWLDRYIDMVSAGLRRAAAVTAPTFTMAKDLVDHFPVPRGVEVVPNGAQVDAAIAPLSRQLQAITAGRLWDEAKGLDILQRLNSPMPILVAGDNTFDRARTDTTWPPHLTHLGSLSQPDLHQRFRESAIYLCTSRYEPFGLAPLEAALCGCCVICRDIPTLREVWQDNALFFTDQRSLEHLLQQLAGDPTLLAAYQERARARACEFTPERMTDSYLDLFDSVLRRHEATHHAA